VLGAGPNPFGPDGSTSPLRVAFAYRAGVARAPAPGVAYRVTLWMSYGLYCGPLCALSFTKARTVDFDASGTPLRVTGDGPPSFVVS
jgi:hypothetical protein